MKLIKRITLISAFVALSGGVQAEWLEIYKFEDGMRVFVDRTTVSQNGGLAELLHLVRWGEPQLTDDSRPYLSTVVRASYDCMGKHERYLSSISYAGPMGGGAKILEDEDAAELWYSISEASMEDKLWTIACAANDSPL